MSLERKIVQVFRSSKQDGMYIYVAKDKGLSVVPDALMARFGRGEPAMVILLDEDKKLARADAVNVLTAIRDNGYYLQLPPTKEESLLDLYKTPTQAIY